ncbi:MAG: class I SAM-dependent methyltransferase, partial [Armatimonadota bacterium]
MPVIVVLVAVVATQHATRAWAASDARTFADKIVRAARVNRGVCAIIGGRRDLPMGIVRASELFVHVRQPNEQAADEVRRAADEAGLGIDRLVVEHGEPSRLPYATNLVDVVVAAGLSRRALDVFSVEEILRVLRPGGKAIIVVEDSAGVDADALRGWAKGGNRIKVWRDGFGTWLRFSKPPLEGVDDWTHWEHGPDNNPVSCDRVIKAPYMTQFMAGPFDIARPAITTAAGGRTFLATGHIAQHVREWETVNRLIARNGYNGVILWERGLPDGYLSHRSAYVASADTFYLMDGDSCLMLDPETGEEKGRIRI